MFPGYRNWSLFWARWIQSISYHCISVRLFLISFQLSPRCFKRNHFYIFIEYTVMQQHHQRFTMVTSFILRFRPSSENESFRIKEKPHNRLNVKMGRDAYVYIYIYIYIYAFFLIISFFLARYMFRLSRVPWFHFHTRILRDVQIFEFLITKFSSASYHFFSFRPKYLSSSPRFQKLIFSKAFVPS